MYPILLQIDSFNFFGTTIGPITFYFIWIFLSLAFLSSLLVISKLYKFRKIKINFLANNSLKIFLFSLLFSRLFFIINNFQNFFSDFNLKKFFELFYIWDKGLSIWGGIIGIALGFYILCKKENENFLAWADILVLCLTSGMVLSNVGTFLDGRNYGTPTSLPWGIIMQTSQYADPIHPTQLYAVLYNLAISITLYYLFNKKKFQDDGNIALLGTFLYSTLRFIEEFFRGDESNIFLFLREPQYYFLIIAAISGYFIYKKHLQKNTENIS